jgi:ABC-2 type transport system ATP-binding protein
MIVALSRGTSETDIHNALQEVNLLQRAKSKYFTLSLGMKQRLALASALIGNPEVLVLDEPTNGLDPEGIAEVRQIIQQQASKGKTIIMASHILDEVEKVCSHVIILKKGKCIAEGKVTDLLNVKQQVVIEPDDVNLFPVVLSQNAKCTVVSKEMNLFTIALEQDYSVAQLNKWLLEQGVSVNRLEPKRSSLEAHFLDLVKND